MTAEYVSAYLAANTDLVEGSTLFVDQMPDDLTEAVALYDESAPPLPESNVLAVDMFGLQVICRATTFATARDRAVEIHQLLLGVSGQLEGAGPTVSMVTVSVPPMSMGRDPENRARWSAHYHVRAESAGGETHRQ